MDLNDQIFDARLVVVADAESDRWRQLGTVGVLGPRVQNTRLSGARSVTSAIPIKKKITEFSIIFEISHKMIEIDKQTSRENRLLAVELNRIR